MFLEGSRAFSLSPQGSFGRCPGILWMLGIIQARSRNVLSLKTEARDSKWNIQERGAVHAAA